MRPSMASSAVVLPAPLGPMRPRMRPSSTRRSMPSTATLLPYALRRPWASMVAIVSALLVGFFGGEQLVDLQAEPLDGGANVRPFVAQELLPLALEQQGARAGVDEHAAAAPA